MAAEQLIIQNFQAHRDLVVPLQPGVTSIVGPTDAGKSAVTRALRWVATNQPQGTAHITHGAKGCAVALVVDGVTVTRTRSTKVNTYTVDVPGQPLATYAVPKTTVPPGVAAVLQLPPICFQGQHDGAFWLADGGGEVAASLNNVVDLGVIDIALEVAGGRVYNARAQHAAAQLAHTAAVAEAASLEWVPEADIDWRGVERANKANFAAMLAHTKLELLVEHAQAARATYQQYSQAAAAARTVYQAGKRVAGHTAAAAALAGHLTAARSATAQAQLAQACRALIATANTTRAALAAYRDTGTVAVAAARYHRQAQPAGAIAQLLATGQVYRQQQAQYTATATALRVAIQAVHRARGVARLAADNLAVTETAAAQVQRCPTCQRPL